MPIDESPDFASRKLQLELTRVRKAQEAARLAAIAAEIELLLLRQFEHREKPTDALAGVPTYLHPAEPGAWPADEAVDRFVPLVTQPDSDRLDPSGLPPTFGWSREAFETSTDDRLRAADALVEAIRRLVRSPLSTQDEGQREGRPGSTIRPAPERGRRTQFESDERSPALREGWHQRLQTLRNSHEDGRPSGQALSSEDSAAAPESPAHALWSPAAWSPAAAAWNLHSESSTAGDGTTGIKNESDAPACRSIGEPTVEDAADRTKGTLTDLPTGSAAVTNEFADPTTAVEYLVEGGKRAGESTPPRSTRADAVAVDSVPDRPQSAESRLAKSQSPGKSQPEEFPSMEPKREKSEGTEEVLVGVEAKLRIAASQAEPGTRRPRPAAWMVSLMSHVALLLALGFLSLSVPQSRDQLALSAAATEATENPVETFTIESPEEVAIDQPEEVSAPAWESESSPLGEGLPSDLAMDLAVGPPTPTVDGLPNPAVTDLASSQLTASSDNRVQFAGIDGGGNHFVYLVDSSNSMKNFNEARQELLRSVESLREDQRFYVIFYDQQPDYMRLSNAGRDESTSLRATDANKLAVRRWSMTITQERGKSPVEALEFAFDLRPDVIFLLSDGEFSVRTEEVIREKNHSDNLFGDAQRLSIVHTIRYPGFSTSEAKKAESQMRRIAEENGGQYRNIEIR